MGNSVLLHEYLQYFSDTLKKGNKLYMKEITLVRIRFALAAGMLIVFAGCGKDKTVENLPAVQKGYEDCTSPDDVQVNAGFSAPFTLPSSYQVDTILHPWTKNFYDSATNWPINQSTFGICETCSSVGLLGYAMYQNTNAISPLYTLFKAYNYPIINDSNIFKPYYLWGDPTLPKLWSFYEGVGYIKYTGTPAYSPDVFPELSANLPLNSNGHPDYTKLPIQMPQPNPWQTNYVTYEADSSVGTIKALTNVKNLVYSYETSVFAGTTHSEKIAKALDKGYLVLIMFRYLYQWDGVKGDATYLFDRFTYSQGQLTHSDTHDSTMYNTWVPPVKSYYVGETHWVYLFSYATAENDTIFFVRNSWGSKRGENGNYYMTASYLNGTYTDPKTKTTSNILKYYYGYKLQ